LVFGQLLAEPGHRPIKMMQVEALDALDPGSFGSRARFVHASSSSLGWFGFDFSVFVSVGRYFAVGSENGERETRVKDAKHWRSRRARSARP